MLSLRSPNCHKAQETWVWSLGWEDPLEKKMATHSSILAWRIPRTEEPGRLWSMRSQRVRHNWASRMPCSLLKFQPSITPQSYCFHKLISSQLQSLHYLQSKVLYLLFSSVQSLSRVWLFATPWTAAHQASLSITSSRTPPKPMSIESVMPFNHLILCHPFLFLPSVFPSIRVFSNESVLPIRWPKYWSFSFSISPSNEHPGLISFRMDWLDLLAVQGTPKSLLQHHSSEASVLWSSAFFMVQLSHPYMTTGRSIASTRRTFVGGVMSLLFNMLSRLAIASLWRSSRLLISRL